MADDDDEPIEAELLPGTDAGAMPAMPDLGGLLDSFQKVQEIRTEIYEGSAGGGAVVVRATGDLQFESVRIDRSVVDPDDTEMLQDLVLAALHDLANSVVAAQQEAMGDLGGLDLGNLFGGS